MTKVTISFYGISEFKKKRLKHREKSFVNWNPNYRSHELKLNRNIRII